ncbi:helix-turn-helix transcriptional regulator [Phenylobacterium sp.]|uniref:helix-turn-helix transcriptional regulator n=1 Tax=Phenylobacterium sp. TaxID=1871053 RepID=UPI002CDBD99D|nr:helix-turn-helix transcriptional regulator [Phenylobacterium sp.]HVI33460.1 helix-turn-helix transcriptional regulator [Phenylobacterium sp.]
MIHPFRSFLPLVEALTDEVELALTYVGQLERGRRNPTLAVVERIARMFVSS